MRRKQKHNTESINIKPRERNQRRTNTKNGQIQFPTEKDIQQ